MSGLKPVKIAILAMGGEGGAELAAWIAGAAGRAGFIAQTTQECGVAERGGAAMYYAELFPEAEAAARGKAPILGLTPLPGEVDLVIATELMEAARAAGRGLVTPDRTALITSTHRIYTVAEKTAQRDGRADSQALVTACKSAAKSFAGFDMAALARNAKSTVNAVLLGAVAGSGVLPIPAALFEEAIRDASAGGDSGVAGFAAGLAAARDGVPPAPRTAPRCGMHLPPGLLEELDRHACGDARMLILAGLERAADYQDSAYAELYWRRLLPFVTLAAGGGDAECELLAVAASQLALAMAYPDVIRVAELKLRASRFARIRAELGLADREILEITEFMHPRIEEVIDTMPAGLGRRVFNSAIGRAVLRKLTAEGRLVHTTSLKGFLLLYFLASLKPLRRGSLRFARETERLEEWLDTVWGAAKRDLRLAISLARAHRLLRGYGETLERGFRKYESIREYVRSNRFSVSASSVNALVTAAQAEEGTAALEAALAKLKVEPQLKVGHFSPAK
jgi:indolepyruvate ferredoxin oxidoreductase beta subunit